MSTIVSKLREIKGEFLTFLRECVFSLSIFKMVLNLELTENFLPKLLFPPKTASLRVPKFDKKKKKKKTKMAKSEIFIHCKHLRLIKVNQS